MQSNLRAKTFLFWMVIVAGFILHNVYHLSGLFFGENIKLPDAAKKVPVSVHIFRIFVDCATLTVALATLVIKNRHFKRFSFVWSALLCAVNFIHFGEAVAKEPQNFSQLALLGLIFVANLILTHFLYREALPWPFLPKRLREWKWAKHQQNWFGKWHLYLGIFAGAILCIVGLTGSILAFQDEIDAALNPKMFRAEQLKPRIPMQEIIPIVQKNFPDRRFDFVRNANPEEPNSTYRFLDLKNEKEFFVNPYTAEICGRRLIHSAFIRVVMDIHTSLLVPAVGKYITGLASLCMMILTISGLRLWIPNNIRRWKQWKEALTVNFRAGFKRQNLDWHNVIGLYSAPAIIVLSLSGFVITFNSVFIGLLFMLNGKSPDALRDIFGKKSEYKKGVVQMPINKVFDKNAALFKSAQLESVQIPSDKTAAYMLTYSAPGKAKTKRLIMTAADQYTGKLLLNSERDFPPVGRSYLDWTTPLHFGKFGGLPTQILACIAGLVPLALFITGFIIWWPRFKKQRNTGIKTLTANQIAKAKKKLHEKRLLHLPAARYFLHFIKYGLKYALIVLAVSFGCGAIYGAVGGNALPAACYVVLYLAMAVIINFIVAVIVEVFQLVALVPFGKAQRKINKYFAISLSFLIVFLPVIFIINRGGNVF